MLFTFILQCGIIDYRRIGGDYMPRPKRCRNVCNEPEYDVFSPAGVASGDDIVLSVDEYEIIRLVDLEQCTHHQASLQMEISRTTATEIYNSARMKIANSIINGRNLVVLGGNYKICNGISKKCYNEKCTKKKNNILSKKVIKKGDNIMRIAVTFENGEIFQHFGHTEEFKIFDVENGEIVKEEIVSSMGSGHGALAGFLKERKVDALICGGIGSGAQTALSEMGIKLYAGVGGSADKAVKALIDNTLEFSTSANCNHHSHNEHNCSGHSDCSGHSCHH